MDTIFISDLNRHTIHTILFATMRRTVMWVKNMELKCQ